MNIENLEVHQNLGVKRALGASLSASLNALAGTAIAIGKEFPRVVEHSLGLVGDVAYLGRIETKILISESEQDVALSKSKITK